MNFYTSSVLLTPRDGSRGRSGGEGDSLWRQVLNLQSLSTGVKNIGNAVSSNLTFIMLFIYVYTFRGGCWGQVVGQGGRLVWWWLGVGVAMSLL